jgi:hypothetical protein
VVRRFAQGVLISKLWIIQHAVPKLFSSLHKSDETISYGPCDVHVGFLVFDRWPTLTLLPTVIELLQVSSCHYFAVRRNTGTPHFDQEWYKSRRYSYHRKALGRYQVWIVKMRICLLWLMWFVVWRFKFNFTIFYFKFSEYCETI